MLDYILAMAENQSNKGDVLMQWTFPEFTEHTRSRGWYIGFLVILALLVLYSLLTSNYTFLMFIVLLALIMVLRFRRPPLDVMFSIRDEGLEVGRRFYPWRELKDFWILYRPPEIKKLYVEFKATARPSLDIALQAQNPLRIRQLLTEHLLENTEREEEPMTDQVTRYLKI